MRWQLPCLTEPVGLQSRRGQNNKSKAVYSSIYHFLYKTNAFLGISVAMLVTPCEASKASCMLLQAPSTASRSRFLTSSGRVVHPLSTRACSRARKAGRC